MNCPSCQTVLADGVPFCSTCGAILTGPNATPAPATPIQKIGQALNAKTSGLAVAGFVCAFLCSLLGLILSIVGLAEIKRSNGTLGGRNFAIAGIVISILAIVLGLGVSGLLFLRGSASRFSESKTDLAKVSVKKLAYEAYPQWSASHPDKACPGSITELFEYMNSTSTSDPWGTPYQFRCGSAMPVGHKHPFAVSAGEDGHFGTPDDLNSDDP